MDFLAPRQAAHTAPAFMLMGALWAVVISALDLLFDGFIYGSIGAVWGVGTPFVLFSLGLYLFGAAIGAGSYALSLRPDMRWIFRAPGAWIAFLFGIMFLAVMGTLVLDLLATEVLPRFSLPLWAQVVVVGFSMLDCALVSITVAGILHWFLSGFMPHAPPGQWILALGTALVLGVIAVFLSNDVRVHVDSIQEGPAGVVVNPVGAVVDTTLPLIEPIDG